MRPHELDDADPESGSPQAPPLPRQQLEPHGRRGASGDHRARRNVTPVGGATVGGDALRMRGVPFVAKSVAGVMPHTDPLRALLAKERRHMDVRTLTTSATRAR
jgi:hypothetical protein